MNTIGLVAVPDGKLRPSNPPPNHFTDPVFPVVEPFANISPLLKANVSPANAIPLKVLSLANVFQGVNGFCACATLYESLPTELK